VNKEEISSQWKSFFLGALIGVVAALIGSYSSWYLQQQTLDKQQTEELDNIASALYIDVSIVEERLKKALTIQSQINKSQLGISESSLAIDLPYYPKNGLYYVFDKDISRFDKETSRDLYAFYNNIIELENRREFTKMIQEKSSRNETVSSDDTNSAHRYTLEAFNFVPVYIKQAEKLKQNLSQRYFIYT
jgi:hypothetical protein